MAQAQTIYRKMLFAGAFSELMTYENGLKIGFKVENRVKTSKGSKKLIRLDNYIRAKGKIKRLAWANSGSFKTFITLTFAENITDFNYANKKLDIFQKRLKRYIPDIMFLGVAEFQKRGAIHYHFLCSDKIPADRLADLWGQGFVKIKAIKNQRNLGLYIVKYMTKELFNEKRYFMKRKFFYSRNLRKPLIIINKDFIDKILNSVYNHLINIKECFSVAFDVDFVGKVQYQLFNVQYLTVQ